jgi:hypothetical protein
MDFKFLYMLNDTLNFIIVVLVIHCDIYKNFHNISELNSPPQYISIAFKVSRILKNHRNINVPHCLFIMNGII